MCVPDWRVCVVRWAVAPVRNAKSVWLMMAEGSRVSQCWVTRITGTMAKEELTQTIYGFPESDFFLVIMHFVAGKYSVWSGFSETVFS